MLPVTTQPVLAQAVPQTQTLSAPVPMQVPPPATTSSVPASSQPPRTPVITRSMAIQQPLPAPHHLCVYTTIQPSTPLSPLPLLMPSDQSEEELAPASFSTMPAPPRMSFVDIQVPPWAKRVLIPSLWRRQLEARERTEDEEYSDYSTAHDNDIWAAILNAGADPKSLAKVQSSPDWPCWKEAMDHELATLKKAGTWVDIPHPTNKNIVSSKWAYHIKRKADGSVDKYKA